MSDQEEQALQIIDRAAARAEDMLKLAADRAAFAVEVAAQRAQETARETATDVAHQAVQAVFLYMGIDASDKDVLKKMKSNLEFLDNIHTSADQMSGAGKKAVAGSIALAVAGMLWLGFKTTVVGWFLTATGKG